MSIPYRQGDLESTCGFYSIVNAYGFLTGESDENCQMLATEIKNYLTRKNLFSSIYDGGMGFYEMKIVMNSVLSKYIKTINTSWMSFPNPDTKTFWKYMNDFLYENEKSCIVFGMSGKQDHWTVGTYSTSKTMKLLDSGGWKLLRYKDCTTTHIDESRYILYPAQTFFLTN